MSCAYVIDWSDFLPGELLDQLCCAPLGDQVPIHKHLLIQGPVVIDDQGNVATNVAQVRHSGGEVRVAVERCRRRHQDRIVETARGQTGE